MKTITIEEMTQEKHRNEMLEAERKYLAGAKTYTAEEILAELDEKYFKGVGKKADD